MKRITKKSARSWLILAAVAVFASTASVSEAAMAGDDNAGNYTSATFTNTSNEGTGFGVWEFNATAEDFIGLTNSAAGSDDINSVNGLSFTFYGGTNGTFAEAIRAFNAPMIEGDEFTATIAYNWNGGARGMNLLDASNTELLNVNFGGDNELSYTFQGESGVVIASNYLGDASIVFTITQLSGNALELDIERNDGFITNITSGSLSSPASKMKFYNGGHSGDDINYALFVNDLELTESTIPTLSLSGRDAMAAGMTNNLVITRGGSIGSEATVSISNSASSVASVPASATLDAGSAETNFPIEGLDLGMTTIEITADGFPTSSLDVAVYDLGYDDSSYAAGVFTNGGNSGLGFMPWMLLDNSGPGDGFTNFAGVFIGDSTVSGGGDVNASSGDAFGLFANQEGAGGGPFVNAVRKLDSDLAVGEVISLEFGVNFRNGTKRITFQNDGVGIFDVTVSGDDYTYLNYGTLDPSTSLGWDYAADTAIHVELKRVATELYNITIVRSGSMPETNELSLVNLGSLAINEISANIFDTESGGENNLYVNRLALYSGETVSVLTLDGNDGMVGGTTNSFSVTRSGATDASLTVTVGNFDDAVLGVTNEIVLGIGVTSVTFDVVGLSNGFSEVTVDAAATVSDSFIVNVYDIAYDDTTYYPPATFDTNGNGGAGFDAWEISDNAGEGDGFTNLVGVFVGASTFAPNINSSEGTSFGLFAKQEGTGGDPLVEATRPFTNGLGIGESLSFNLAVNFRNGAKGAMLQNNGTWLFEISVFNDEYYYNIRDAGDNPVALGWPYASDTQIGVTFSRTSAGSYNVLLTRDGSAPASTLVEGITLSAAPDRVRFYVFNTDNGGSDNDLYVNDLTIYTGIVGGLFTDGIPDSWWDKYNVAVIDRVAAGNIDGDVDPQYGEPISNWEEYVADTDPTNSASFFPNLVITMSGGDVVSLETGPTTNSRVYDVWWTTNLLADPQEWTRYGLNMTGDAGGGNVMLDVSNDVPSRVYRTGVALP